jgi:hypothetical protein
MPRASIQLRKFAILTHRWMGVMFCVLFLLWFASGIVMMYWDYPGVSSEERLARAEILDPSRIQVSPEQASRILELDRPPDQVRLAMYDGRPVYRFRLGRGQSIVYADSGEQLIEFPLDMTRRVAAAWTGQPAGTAKFELNTEEDQWTVSQSFWPLRPLDKYSWPNGEEVYVSEGTGEVVQYTTRSSRIGAYLGAIPHWLYFTPLRKNGLVWTRVVIWSSGIGTVASLFGLIVGITLYSPSKRFRFPEGASSVPYKGQKRWHTILGLTFGLVTCTWALSGMLSMSPFEFLSGGRGGAALAGALRGGRLPLKAFAAKSPQEALAQAGADLKVKELELTSFAGEPVYLATEAPRRSRIIPVQGQPMAEFDRNRLIETVTKGVRPKTVAEVRWLSEYEAYYLDRHGERPLPVLFVRLNDEQNSMYYIDPKTARIVQGYTSGASRWNRWLYHGLHSMDFPWLYRYRPAWDIVVLALMLGGTALCVTSVVIGWRRVRQKIGIWRARGALKRRLAAGRTGEVNAIS